MATYYLTFLKKENGEFQLQRGETDETAELDSAEDLVNIMFNVADSTVRVMVICTNEPLALVNNTAEYENITEQLSRRYVEKALRCTGGKGVHYRCFVRPCCNANGKTFETAFVCMVKGAEDSCAVCGDTQLNKHTESFSLFLRTLIDPFVSIPNGRSQAFSEKQMKELKPLIQFVGDWRKEIQIILLLPAEEFQAFEDETLWFPAELEYVILCQSPGEKIAQQAERIAQLEEKVAQLESIPRATETEEEIEQLKGKLRAASEETEQLKSKLRAAKEWNAQLEDALWAVIKGITQLESLLGVLSSELLKELAERFSSLFSSLREYITSHGKDFDWSKEEENQKIQLLQEIEDYLKAVISGIRALELETKQETKVETADTDRGTEINKAEQVISNPEHEQKIDDKEERISRGAVNPPHPRDEPER